MNYSIDINCDMGEEMPHDALIMPFISSANIACGYHAGNEKSMHATIELALRHGVAIGAHPSYPDKEHFGRTDLLFSPQEIYGMVQRQLEMLGKQAAKCHASLHHVKPHGALYNMGAQDEAIAIAIAKAVHAFDKTLILYGMGNLIAAAKSISLSTCYEVFADRTYQEDGTLTPRKQANALISNSEEVQKQVLEMVFEQRVVATSGKLVPVKAETICIHGDGADAPAYACMIHECLRLQNIKITAP